jgi:hypothetical protein
VTLARVINIIARALMDGIITYLSRIATTREKDRVAFSRHEEGDEFERFHQFRLVLEGDLLQCLLEGSRRKDAVAAIPFTFLGVTKHVILTFLFLLFTSDADWGREQKAWHGGFVVWRVIVRAM